MFLSIIVPVYNIEKYIGRCLDSILKVCTDDCEIVLVTGDSSDSSNQICKEYQEAFSNVRVLRQSGTGLSNARNCAFDNATGKYIAYIDGDDYVDSGLFGELIERLWSVQDDIDLVVTDFRRVSAIGNRVENVYQIGEHTLPQSDISFLPEMLRKKQCFWNVWRFIYKRSFLEEHGIRFRENVLSEDIDYTTKVLLANPRPLFVHCPFYHYCVGRGDSLMDRPTYKRLQDTLDILCSSIRLVESSSYAYSQLLIGQYQFEYILNIAITCEIAEEDVKKARMLYGETLDILCVGSDRLSRFVRGLLYIVPLPILAEALHLLKLCKRIIKRGSRKAIVGGKN